MSKKRKILLLFTIGIIIICYGIAFVAIINHEDQHIKTESSKPVKTGYKEFDRIANEVEEYLKENNNK